MEGNAALRKVTVKNYTEFSTIISQHLRTVKELPPPPDALYDVGSRPKDIVISYCGFKYQDKKPLIHVELDDISQPLVLPETKSKLMTKSKNETSQREVPINCSLDLRCPCGCLSAANLTRAQQIHCRLQKGVCVYHYRKPYLPMINEATETAKPNDTLHHPGQPQNIHTYQWWYPLSLNTVRTQNKFYDLTHSSVSTVYSSILNAETFRSKSSPIDQGIERHQTHKEDTASIPETAINTVSAFPGIFTLTDTSLSAEHSIARKKWAKAHTHERTHGFLYSSLLPSNLCPEASDVESITFQPLTDTTLRFESRFESGNLLQATRLPMCTETGAPESDLFPYKTECITNTTGVTAKYRATDQTYFLMLRPDTNSMGNTQWYYFAVGNTIPGIRYNFFIANFTKTSSQYSDGMTPVIFSETEYMLSGRGWERGGFDVAYYSNNRYLNVGSGSLIAPTQDKKAKNSDYDDSQDDSQAPTTLKVPPKTDTNAGSDVKPVSCLLGSYYTLSFSYIFKYAGDIVYFAHTYPYTYEHEQLWINSLIHKNMLQRRHINNRLTAALNKALMLDNGVDSLAQNNTIEGGGLSSLDKTYMLEFAKAYYAYSHLKVKFLQKLAAFRTSPIYQIVAKLLASADHKNIDIPILSHKVITKSIGGNDVDMLTITSPSTSMQDLKSRKIIIVSARIHPGEAQSSYVCQGLVDYLLSDAPIARLLRKLYIFKVFPMINPDGVILGNYRCNLAGADLNRRCVQPSMALHTCVYGFKKVLLSLVSCPSGNLTKSATHCEQQRSDSAGSSNSFDSSGSKDSVEKSHGKHHYYTCSGQTEDLSFNDLVVADDAVIKPPRQPKSGPQVRPATCKPSVKRIDNVSGGSTNSSENRATAVTNTIILANIDLHGHSRKTNVFGYACYGDSEDHFYFKALNRLSPYFSIKDCRYSIGKQKECTQRAVSYNSFHIQRSYCIETTFGGITKTGSPKFGLQMCQKDFLEVGKDLAQNMLYLEGEQLASLHRFADEFLVQMYSLLYNSETKNFIVQWFGSQSILASKPNAPRTLLLNDPGTYKQLCDWVHENVSQEGSCEKPENKSKEEVEAPVPSAVKRGPSKKKTVCFNMDMDIASNTQDCASELEKELHIDETHSSSELSLSFPNLPPIGSTITLPYIYTEDDLHQDLYIIEQVKAITSLLPEPSALSISASKLQKPDQDGHSSDDDVQVEVINPSKSKHQRKRLSSSSGPGVPVSGSRSSVSPEGIEQLAKEIIAAQTDEAQLEHALESEINIKEQAERPSVGLSVKKCGKLVYKSLPLRSAVSDASNTDQSLEQASNLEQKSSETESQSKAKSKTSSKHDSLLQDAGRKRQDRTNRGTSSGDQYSKQGGRTLDGFTNTDPSEGILPTEGFKTSWGGGTEKSTRKTSQADLFSRLAKNPYKILPEKREYMQEAMQATSRLATYSIVTHTAEDLPVDRVAANIASRLQKGLTSSRVWDDSQTQRVGTIPASHSFAYSQNSFSVMKEQAFGENADNTDAGPFIAPRRPGSSQRAVVSSTGWRSTAQRPTHARLVSVPQVTTRTRPIGRASVQTQPGSRGPG
ncbi:Nuclear ATP/GTP-binding protein [Giardia lamblia P15]|uniref:Nuclear ATP/GTP-binding protein n=1 Tax=Giardia intestinalis (strain P15) TaxID=658858 RepID=E1F7Y6_GIAIA|nr:Nuclear ATP/GTP-binding protein [Giardia lamblia P15]